MTGDHTTQAAAQRRVDRMRAFDAELAELEREGVLRLSSEDRARLETHRASLLAAWRERFDVDVSETERQTSWGMRIAATLGATALALSVFLLFYRYWGLFPTAAQVVVLVAAPLLSLTATELVGRRERGRYFTALLAALSFATFVLDLNMLGEIFSITPTQHALAVWSALALILAYTHGLPLLLLPGLVCAIGWLSGSIAALQGADWMSFFERPEEIAVAGALVAAVPFVRPHATHDRFPMYYRLAGLLTVFVCVLILANWGRASHLPLTEDAVEIVYQILGFALSGLAIWIGIRLGLRDAVNAGAGFFIVLLYVKLFDWWWDALPKYLFFLVLGLIAVGLLWLLGRVRRRMRVAT